MFADDRDLLVYEPRVFLELGWLGQKVFGGTGSVGSGLMVLPGLSASSAGVSPGSVVSYGGASYEVVQVLAGSQLGLSRMRGSTADPVIAVPSATGVAVECFTYRPQMRVVHDQILRMLGIDPAVSASVDGVLGEDSVVNADAFTRLECLGTLHLVYSAASAAGGSSGSSAGAGLGVGYAERSLMYRERFAAERLRVAAEIDLDGDGEAEAVRRPGVSHLVRG